MIPTPARSARWWGVVWVGAVITCILLLKAYGVFTSFELAFYDAMIRHTQSEHWSASPVTVVNMVDRDTIGIPTLDDETLATLLEKICASKPRSIGIDLLRDVPVPPGSARLEEVLSACREIVGVSYYGDSDDKATGPPPALSEGGRYGFGDVLVDPDYVVRRGFLALDRQGQNPQFSLSLRLARMYLRAENISITSSPQPGIQVGPTRVPRLSGNDGGYVRAEEGGYQFLIDFRDPPESITELTLGDVLDGKVKPQLIENRIVLIGNRRSAAKDHFVTPLQTGKDVGERMSGVLLHARMAQQLLRYGHGQSKPMRFIPEWGEFALIVVWGAGAALLAEAVAGRIRFLAIAAGVIAATFAISILLFRVGWWAPPVVWALTFVPVAVVVREQRPRPVAKPRVFLSYAHEDQDAVERIRTRLEDAGFEAWMDRTGIEPGQRWEDAIHREIRNTDSFVVCISGRTAAKDYVLQEITQALDISKAKDYSHYRIVPARLEDVPIPNQLQQFQWVDLWTENGWSAFIRVLYRRTADRGA